MGEFGAGEFAANAAFTQHDDAVAQPHEFGHFTRDKDDGLAVGFERIDEFVDFEFGADVDPARTFVFGCSDCGDMIIYTAEGRGGWLCHENGKIHLLGTIEDTIEWVYSELLANRFPEFDHKW